MRDHSHHIELSRAQAVQCMLDCLHAVPFGAMGALWSQASGEACVPAQGPIRQVSLSDAYGRVLADDVTAVGDVPNVLNCAMDSIAVHWDDFAELDEDAVPDTSAWERGVQWEFANTGTAMPEGFDTAIVIENVEVSDDEQSVRILKAPSERFAGTRAPGAVLKAGEVVARAGTVVTPDVAARIAGAGRSAVRVVTPPRVAFIPTGNELVPANLPLSAIASEKWAARGRTFESNSAVVRGKVEAWGGIFIPFDIVPDDPHAIRRAVQEALGVADIVVLNAGSSKGSDDWSVEVLEEMGHVICHQTNHGPGHHSSYAVVDGKPVVGISGPSGGASFTLNFYLRPLMMAFLGQDPAPALLPVRLTAPFAARKRKPDTVKAGEERPSVAGVEFYGIKFLNVFADASGQLLGTPVNARPGLGTSLANSANAYYLLPDGPGIEPPAAGDVIYVELR